MNETSIPFLAPPSREMQHTPLTQPPPATQLAGNPSFQPLLTRDRLDSFKSLSLSAAPDPSPPSPFFQPIYQPQRLPLYSHTSSSQRAFTPNPLVDSQARYPISTT